MRAASVVALILVVQLGACALLPEPNAHTRTQPQDLDAFMRLVEEDIQSHEWQNLLAASDPTLFRARVVEGGAPEPLFLAELLGLAEPGNRIQEGDEVAWEDLARIQTVTLAPIGDGEPPYRLGGQVGLTTGSILRLDVGVTRVQGRYVLTDAEAMPLADDRD
jgi:hypothetical protein